MSTQHMYLTISQPPNDPYRTGKPHVHRIGVLAARKDDDGRVTFSASMVSKTEPYGFNAKKGVDKALNRLNSPRHTLTLNRFEVLNGYPLDAILRKLRLSSENNFFFDIDRWEQQRRFESSMRVFLRPPAPINMEEIRKEAKDTMRPLSKEEIIEAEVMPLGNADCYVRGPHRVQINNVTFEPTPACDIPVKTKNTAVKAKKSKPAKTTKTAAKPAKSTKTATKKKK